MPRTLSRLKCRKLLVNVGLFAWMVLIATTITILYISQEHNFHWWIDWHYKTIEVATAFSQSPIAGINNVLQSLGDERNKIYTLPLVPFILIFGKSRLVYQISLTLIYLLPFSLSLGGVATQLIGANPHNVFWSTALLSLLISVTWIPSFLGVPDTGGALLVTLATFIYLQDIKLKQWWRIPVIGLCLGFSILLRRHFVYDAIAFLGAATSLALIFLFVETRQAIAWRIQSIGVRIGLIAVICFGTVTGIASEFTYRAIATDYRHLYASWSLPINNVVSLYAAYYGWVTLLLVAIGFSSGILTRVLSWDRAGFILLFGIFCSIEWLILLRYGNVFYSLHFTPVIVIGLAAFVWTSSIKLTGTVRTSILLLASCYLVGNLVIGLTPLGNFKHPLRPLFALSIPPLVRTDYNQVVQLVEYLHKLALRQEPIYIVGFQRLQLNGSMIRAAERILYPQKQDRLLILRAPQIDSQDFYPLETLLQSQYVVIPNPLPNYQGDFTQVSAAGEWLPLKESDVVKVVFDAFNQNWQIAQDFQRLPVKFTLADGVVVSIYQRIRPTSLETAVQTLALMQQQIGERPGGQLDWIGLTQYWNQYSILKNPNKTYRLLIYPNEPSKQQTTSFLYLGSLPQRAAITGRLNFFGNHCNKASLRLTLLNQTGHTVSTLVNQSFLPNSTKFHLSIAGNAAYLLLDIMNQDQQNLTNRCTLDINFLTVSPQK